MVNLFLMMVIAVFVYFGIKNISKQVDNLNMVRTKNFQLTSSIIAEADKYILAQELRIKGESKW